MSATVCIDGAVAPGFEWVRTEFERSFAERGDIGVAVAAYWRGETVVDLWGGRRMLQGDAPWNQDTMVFVNSKTKDSTRDRKSLFCLRRPRGALGLRVCDEQNGFLPGQRSAGDGAAKRGVSRDHAGAMTMTSAEPLWRRKRYPAGRRRAGPSAAPALSTLRRSIAQQGPRQHYDHSM